MMFRACISSLTLLFDYQECWDLEWPTVCRLGLFHNHHDGHASLHHIHKFHANVPDMDALKDPILSRFQTDETNRKDQRENDS